MRRIYALSLVVALSACTKSGGDAGGAKDSGSDPGAKDDGNGGGGSKDQGDPAQTAGDVAIETGAMTLNLAAVSSADSFATANQERNANVGAPGTLTLGFGLDGQASASSTLPESWPNFHPNSITSGAPDGFRVAITKIVLDYYDPSDSSPSQSARATLIDNAEGLWLKVESGSVDLSEIIAAANTGGSAATFDIPVGTYNRINVEFKRQAEIKGCVYGDFLVAEGGLEAAQGPHTYCTRAGYSTFDDVPASPADYEGLDAAEWMAFDLEVSDIGPEAASGTTTSEFRLQSPLEVTKGQSVELSLVFDLNRMLRFYNRGRVDQGPVPAMPTNRAYFFTTLFSSSVYAFAGLPGRIYGYQGLAEVCRFNDYNSGNGICSNEQGTVAFWMTIITSGTGQPIVVSLMPDDDNTLTVIKGTQSGVSVPFDSAGEGLVNIHYGLDQGELGQLSSFPADLESAAVGAEISGVTFSAQQSGDCGEDCHFQGQVHVARQL